jgi:hypothetical protein
MYVYTYTFIYLFIYTYTYIHTHTHTHIRNTKVSGIEVSRIVKSANILGGGESLASLMYNFQIMMKKRIVTASQRNNTIQYVHLFSRQT